MRRIAAAIAAITLMAGTAHAQGHGGGGGGGNRGGGNENAMRGGGGGGGNAMRGGGGGNDQGNRGGGNAERGNNGGGGPSMAQSMRGNDQRGNSGGGNAMREARGNQGQGNAERGNRDGGSRGNAGRGQGNDNGLNGTNARGNGGNDRAVARDNRGRGNDDRVLVDRGRGNGNRNVVIDRDGDVDVVRVRDFDRLGPRGLINGCPPGLAKKNPPCVPPGQVRNDYRNVLGLNRPDFWGMGIPDGRYVYDDGYLIRLGPTGGIGGYIPLLGGALGIGQVWPTYYEPYRLPTYYEQYYGLGPYQSYRYADNVIYRLDPETAAITSVAALLTGDDFVVGQPMPIGYDIYNVPYGYRDRYVDGPNAYYRYADGYIYQVDPETQLIAAAIQLLAS